MININLAEIKRSEGCQIAAASEGIAWSDRFDLSFVSFRQGKDKNKTIFRLL